MTEEINSIERTFSVSWTHRLHFTSNSFAEEGVLGKTINDLKPLKLLVVLDGGLVNANEDLLNSIEKWMNVLDCECFNPIQVTGGEAAKNNSSVVDTVLEAINSNNLCRKSAIIVIGGGAVLDAVGFAASIAHRGIKLIRMPSTTLSQCDSGVGVKNGINLFGKKNFTGVFDPPFAVINDIELLRTLDDRHWKSGLSEAVKVSLVKDRRFFNEIESSSKDLLMRNMEVMESVVRQSAILHFSHITDGGDPFELLDARPLDFGHWAAHKLEQLTDYDLTHGEAVSIGLAIDIRCSVLLGLLEEKTSDRAINTLQSLELPTFHQEMNNPLLIDGIEEFRQHLGGELTLLMLEDIGKPVNVHNLDSRIIKQAIDDLL
ncbi:MAG: 3-dehydroquinate synthase [Phycisphaerales bacterium]|nr:3-dehydroquinate synthase [Phycisphaerales bacterium]